MTRARSELISLSETPWYHLVNRCVRRAFLCGEDRSTGVSYEHRKDWIETRMRQLASVFAIDLSAYAVMSNHYHIVVRVNQERAEAWTGREVLEKWQSLFSLKPFMQKFLDNESLSEGELNQIKQFVALYRQRLFDISWYMRVLNESIARMANKEDQVKGRFWEGRFKSQALLDEQAILSVMAYVDLNPVRAGISDSIKNSDHTAIQARIENRANEQNAPQKQAEKGTLTIRAAQKQAKHSSIQTETIPLQKFNALKMAALLPFDSTARTASSIPFALDDYLEMVDFLGRAHHPAKCGFIAERQPKLIEQLGINVEFLMEQELDLLEKFGEAIGSAKLLEQQKLKKSTQFVHGMAVARQLFKT